MKNITIIIVLCYVSALFAIDSFDAKERSKNELIALIHAELDELAILEGEIEYFNSLLIHRKKAKELYDAGKISELNKLFNTHTRKLESYFEKGNFDLIRKKVGELKIIYTKFDFVNDQLMYYDAKLLSVSKNELKAQEKLEYLIQNYPNSPKLDNAIFLLAEMYFKTDENQKLIDIYGRLSGENTVKHQFWLGNAYFNLGRYEESTNVFKTFTKDPEYGFKAKLMLALNSYFTQGADVAIDYFTLLKEIAPIEDPDFSFIVLSLARLYSEIDKDDIALIYYEQYVILERDYGIEDEVLFEIATAYNNNKKFDQAILYFIKITEKPRKSEYFASAKFYIAVAELNKGDFEGAQAGINDMIYQNQLLMETINQKYYLLDKYSILRKKLFDPNLSEEEFSATKSKLVKVERALETTNKLVQDLYLGLNPYSLKVLESVEAEYLSYSDMIDDMDIVIKIAETTPNRKMANKMDDKIDALNTDLIGVQILSYIGEEGNYTYDEFRFARTLANEKISTQLLIEEMNEIKVLAEVKRPKVAASVAKIIDLLALNIESIDTIAKYSFTPNLSSDEKQIIAAEIESIESNKKSYELLKESILKNFNKKIAKKLQKQRDLFADEFVVLREYYDGVLTSAMEDVAIENDKYEMSLLNILFKQTQNEDEDYKALQEKIRNE
jgi:TolA-binding protein